MASPPSKQAEQFNLRIFPEMSQNVTMLRLEIGIWNLRSGVSLRASYRNPIIMV
jgi:hypothetical protein